MRTRTTLVYDAIGRAYRSVKGLDRELAGNQRLMDDLDLDSLDMIDLLTSLEEELGASLLEPVGSYLSQTSTLGEFATRVEDALGDG